MLDWPQIIDKMNRGEAMTLVTVVSVSGSSPREVGAKMLVSEQRCWGTIGGGTMEFQAIDRSRDILQQQSVGFTQWIHARLTPRFDQCCGGQVSLAFEKISLKQTTWLQQLAELQVKKHQAWCFLSLKANGFVRFLSASSEYQNINQALFDATNQTLIENIQPPKMSVVVFGAGHVGQAIIHQLQLLETKITWIDWRSELAPDFDRNRVQFIHQGDAKILVDQADKDSFFLVLTHSHQLDFDLVSTVLEKGEFAYLGLIGSRKKKQRFEQLLSQQFHPALVNKMTCPIGLPTIKGKTPEVIAASVVAQLLQLQSQQMTSVSVDATELKGKLYV